MVVITAFVTNVWGLLAVLAGSGAAAGSVQALHRPLLLDTYRPDARVRVLSIHQGASIIGMIVAPVLVAIVTAAAGFTWRGVFLVMGVVSLAGAALSVRLRDPGFGRHDVRDHICRLQHREGRIASRYRIHPARTWR